jgi:hypothetical protein
MMKRITLVSALALVPFASQAQALLNVSGQWEYRDASKMETDEGLNLCFQLDSASIARSPQLRQHGGALCARATPLLVQSCSAFLKELQRLDADTMQRGWHLSD